LSICKWHSLKIVSDPSKEKILFHIKSFIFLPFFLIII
jgi:hypothetical protein